jgi:hypothetical protein
LPVALLIKIIAEKLKKGKREERWKKK